MNSLFWLYYYLRGCVLVRVPKTKISDISIYHSITNVLYACKRNSVYTGTLFVPYVRDSYATLVCFMLGMDLPFRAET